MLIILLILIQIIIQQTLEQLPKWYTVVLVVLIWLILGLHQLSIDLD